MLNNTSDIILEYLKTVLIRNRKWSERRDPDNFSCLTTQEWFPWKLSEIDLIAVKEFLIFLWNHSKLNGGMTSILWLHFANTYRWLKQCVNYWRISGSLAIVVTSQIEV